jgi:hypothetical protein
VACGSSLYTLSGNVADGPDPEQLSYQMGNFDQLAWHGESVSFFASGNKCELKLDPQFVVTARIIKACACLAVETGQSIKDTPRMIECFHRAVKVVETQLKSHGELVPITVAITAR